MAVVCPVRRTVGVQRGGRKQMSGDTCRLSSYVRVSENRRRPRVHDDYLRQGDTISVSGSQLQTSRNSNVPQLILTVHHQSSPRAPSRQLICCIQAIAARVVSCGRRGQRGAGS